MGLWEMSAKNPSFLSARYFKSSIKAAKESHIETQTRRASIVFPFLHRKPTTPRKKDYGNNDWWDK
jgi:hypothetical protein